MLKIAVLTLAISACASANADPTCTVSASGVAFGNYNPLANANADGTGSVSVTCTGSATVTYTIGASTGSGAYLARKLVSGSQTLNYNVYVDNTRTTIWGDGSSGTSLLSETSLRRLEEPPGIHCVWAYFLRSGNSECWIVQRHIDCDGHVLMHLGRDSRITNRRKDGCMKQMELCAKNGPCLNHPPRGMVGDARFFHANVTCTRHGRYLLFAGFTQSRSSITFGQPRGARYSSNLIASMPEDHSPRQAPIWSASIPHGMGGRR